MIGTWRRFGPRDIVATSAIRHAGATGGVSALHHVPPGTAWTGSEIAGRQRAVAALPDGGPSALAWRVVESLPVSEDIRRQAGAWRANLDARRASLRSPAEAGIATICDTFRPVLDWTRTDLAHRPPTGATCMRFDLVDSTVFAMHLLARSGAAEDCDGPLRAAAARRLAAMDDADRAPLALPVPGDEHEGPDAVAATRGPPVQVRAATYGRGAGWPDSDAQPAAGTSCSRSAGRLS